MTSKIMLKRNYIWDLYLHISHKATFSNNNYSVYSIYAANALREKLL